MYYVDEIMGTTWLPVIQLYPGSLFLFITDSGVAGATPQSHNNTWQGSAPASLSLHRLARLSPCAKSPGSGSVCVRPSWLARYSGPGAPDLSFSCPGAASFPRTVLMAGLTWDTPHLHASLVLLTAQINSKKIM